MAGYPLFRLDLTLDGSEVRLKLSNADGTETLAWGQIPGLWLMRLAMTGAPHSVMLGNARNDPPRQRKPGR